MSGLKSKFVTPLYFMQQGQVQIMQYNQMGHTATWQESSMEIKKDAECWFLGNIYKMNWQFHSVKVAMLGINRSRNKLSGHHWALQHVLFWPVFNKYVHKINKGREMQSDIKVTLYCLSATFYVFFQNLKFVLFYSLQYNFRCKADIRHKCMASISWRGLNMNCINRVRCLTDTSALEENMETRQMTPIFPSICLALTVSHTFTFLFENSENSFSPPVVHFGL